MKFLLVCEGVGDERDLHTLTWKALQYANDAFGGFHTMQEAGLRWIAPHALHAADGVTWHDAERGEQMLRWADISKRCDELRVPKVLRPGRGHGFHAATRALNLLLRLVDGSAAEVARVVIVHDTDGDDAWRASLLAARDEWLAEHRASMARLDVDVAVGVAHPEHEAWVIAAFIPRTEAEREVLEALRRELGFRPTEHPERLASGREVHRRDAKRVLDALVAGAPSRRAEILEEAALEMLVAVGATCGLADFIVELVTRAATIWGPVSVERVEALRPPAPR